MPDGADGGAVLPDHRDRAVPGVERELDFRRLRRSDGYFHRFGHFPGVVEDVHGLYGHGVARRERLGHGDDRCGRLGDDGDAAEGDDIPRHGPRPGRVPPRDGDAFGLQGRGRDGGARRAVDRDASLRRRLGDEPEGVHGHHGSVDGSGNVVGRDGQRRAGRAPGQIPGHDIMRHVQRIHGVPRHEDAEGGGDGQPHVGNFRRREGAPDDLVRGVQRRPLPRDAQPRQVTALHLVHIALGHVVEVHVTAADGYRIGQARLVIVRAKVDDAELDVLDLTFKAVRVLPAHADARAQGAVVPREGALVGVNVSERHGRDDHGRQKLRLGNVRVVGRDRPVVHVIDFRAVVADRDLRRAPGLRHDALDEAFMAFPIPVAELVQIVHGGQDARKRHGEPHRVRLHGFRNGSDVGLERLPAPGRQPEPYAVLLPRRERHGFGETHPGQLPAVLEQPGDPPGAEAPFHKRVGHADEIPVGDDQVLHAGHEREPLPAQDGPCQGPPDGAPHVLRLGDALEILRPPVLVAGRVGRAVAVGVDGKGVLLEPFLLVYERGPHRVRDVRQRLAPLEGPCVVLRKAVHDLGARLVDKHAPQPVGQDRLCPPRRADFRQQVVDAHGRIAAHDLKIGEALRPAVVVPPLQFGDVQPRVGHAVGLRHGRALQYVAEQRRGIVRDARHPCLRPVIVVRHHAFDRGVDVVHRPVELIRGLHPQFQPCQRLPGVEGPAPRVRPHPLPDAGQAARAFPARRVVIVARRQAHLELVLAAGQVEGELPREGRAGIVAGQGKRLGPGAQARARREGHGQPGSGRRAALDAHRVAPVLHLDDGVPLHADVGEQLLVLPDGGQPPDIRYVVPPPLVPAHERQQPLGRLPGLAVRGRARPLDDAAGPVERKRVPAVQLDLHGFGPQLLRHAVGGQPPVFGVEVAVLIIDQRGVDGRGTGLQRERGRVDALVGFGEVPIGQQAVAHLKRGRGVHLLPGGRTPPQAGRPVEHELRLIDVVARLEGVAGAAFQRDAELLLVGVARVQLRGLVAAVAPVHVELHMLVFPKRRIPVADVGDFHRAVPGGVRGAQVVELFRGPLGVRLAEVVQRHAPDAEHLRDDLKRAQAVLAAGQKIDLGARAAHVQPRHFRRGRQQRAPEHGQAEARGEQQARPHGRRHAQKPGHGRPARAARPPRQRGGRNDGDHAEDGLAALAGQHSERHHVAGAGERGPPCLIRHIAHVEVGVPAPAHPCRNPHGVALFPDDRRKRLSPRHHTIHARLQGRGPADHPYALRDAASRRQPLPGITVHPANTFFPAPGRIRLNDGVPALKHMQHPARGGHEPHMGLHPLDPQAHHVAGAGIARRLPERLPRQIKRGLDGGPIQRGHVNDRARQGDAEPLAVDQTHQPPAVGPGSPATAVTERHPDIVIPPCVHSHPPHSRSMRRSHRPNSRKTSRFIKTSPESDPACRNRKGIPPPSACPAPAARSACRCPANRKCPRA